MSLSWYLMIKVNEKSFKVFTFISGYFKGIKSILYCHVQILKIYYLVSRCKVCLLSREQYFSFLHVQDYFFCFVEI